MNIVGIVFKIMELLPAIIQTVETIRGAGQGPRKKEDVRRAVKVALTAADTFTKLSITDQKKFYKELDMAIDATVGMLNASEWK